MKSHFEDSHGSKAEACDEAIAGVDHGEGGGEGGGKEATAELLMTYKLELFLE